MIVICTKCHAKFRIADDRVGPRGAKVRCSKCKAVFLVAPREPEPQRPPPLPPPLPTSSGARLAPAAFEGDPFAVDPFSAPAQDPFAASAAALAADPFAAADFTRLPAGPNDPPPAPADPFAPADTADPFGGPAATSAVAGGAFEGGARLPVTDLADLLGPATPAAFPAPRSEPARGLFASPASPGPALDPALDGLALEDRTTPAPSPLPRASEVGGVPLDELGHPEPGLDPAFDFGGVAEDGALALATEPTPGRIPLVPGRDEPAAPAYAEPPSPARPRTAGRPAARGARDDAASAGSGVAQAPAPGAGRVPVSRGARARAAAVNAVALAALLLAALAILVVWRADGPLDASAFRPHAVLRALRTAAPPGPFAAQGIRSGLYEREKGPPVLFVRGEVVSRAPAPVAVVRVDVEVVREGRVIARGDTIAGAVPEPEELHRARDASALASLARAVARRAPSEVRPGDVVPFLVTIGDHPADLSGASLRIALSGPEAPAR